MKYEVRLVWLNPFNPWLPMLVRIRACKLQFADNFQLELHVSECTGVVFGCILIGLDADGQPASICGCLANVSVTKGLP